MWWLVPVAVAGAAAAIWKLADNDARDARRRWESQREEVRRTVEEHRTNIEQNLHRAQVSYDFHLLTDLHFSSHRVADHAYSALRDAQKSLDVMGKMLVEAKKRREELKAQKRASTSREEKAQLQQEIDLLNELRAEVFPDKDAVKEQRDGLRAELQLMNQRTRELKLAIRDRCGWKGEDWYERLEARTAARRAREGRPRR
jgi:hypothetical protein